MSDHFDSLSLNGLIGTLRAQICFYDFHQCVSVISDSTIDRQVHTALVWRFQCSLDELHDVFSGFISCWIRLRTLDSSAVITQGTMVGPVVVAVGCVLVFADRTE